MSLGWDTAWSLWGSGLAVPRCTGAWSQAEAKKGPGNASGSTVGELAADQAMCSQFTVSLFYQVLYKLAWSESMERDCTATCAKK